MPTNIDFKSTSELISGRSKFALDQLFLDRVLATIALNEVS